MAFTELGACRKETRDVCGSGEALGDGDQALFGLVLLGSVVGPRLKVRAFCGPLCLGGCGSDGLGKRICLSMVAVFCS